jgi:hypothetical protein
MKRHLFRILVPFALLSSALAFAAPPALAAPKLGVDLSYDEASELQLVRVSATSGQFRLIFGSGGPGVSETGDLEYNAPGPEVEAALNALTNIASGGGSVRVEYDPIIIHGYVVTFNGGPLRNTDIPELRAVHGTVPFSGGGVGVTVRTLLAGGVHHSDERVDFTARVSNTAPKTESVTAGTILTCEGGEWTQEGSPGFALSFEWFSNGVPVGTGATYEAQASDEGNALQCVVTAHNDGGAGIQASLPLAPVSAPTYSGSGSREPDISRTILSETEWEYTCTPPPAGAWSGSPTWSYQWLRNGALIAGATSPTYVAHIGPGEEDHLVALQCQTKGTNAGGAILTITNVPTGRPFTGSIEEFEAEYGAFPPIRQGTAGSLPRVVDPNSTVGPLTLEVELPAGQETLAYETEGSGWTCEKLSPAGAQPATARCRRGDSLAPGQEYPPLTVVTALGADAPNLAAVTATAFGGGASSESVELDLPIQPALPFGLSKWTAPLFDPAGNEYTQAGGHPYLGESELVLNRKRGLVVTGAIKTQYPIEQLKQVFADLPPGTIGNPSALPALCPGLNPSLCPQGSQVGFIHLLVHAGHASATESIYAVEPDVGAPAEFFFTDISGNVYTLTPRLRPGDGYAISLEVGAAPKVDFLESTLTLCGFGVKPGVNECYEPGEPGANPKPFITAPTRCGVPFTTRVRLNSWDNPNFVEGPPFTGAPISGCDKVPFEPKIKVVPTTNHADSPTGLKAELSMPTEGLEEPEGLSQSHLRNVKVTLPKGLAVNPAGANGLEACSEAQIGISDQGVPNNNPASCPTGSRIGSVEVITPLLKKPLDGAVYQAEQDRNPFHSTIAIYVLAEDAQRGVRLKLPGKVELDPQSGQLTSTFSDTPQQPFKRFRLEFFGGATAPLRTPEACGTYSTESELTPWSGGPPVSETNSYAISQSPGSEEGSGGGECPTSPAAMTNAPEFDAGTVTPVAGSYSPFVVRLARQDGSQRFAAIDVTPPPGLTAKLAGTPPCPEAAIAAAEAKSGHEEEAHPSCPAASHVGVVHVATGAGPAPYWATGQVYLAGPYKGAPLSFAIITPAVAGPFDLGTVVTKTALHLDPASAQITATSDPIPQLLDGIPLDVRSVAIAIDRPQFTLNGTSCDPLAITGEAISPLGSSAPLSERFQLGECARLHFKPKLSLRLFGGTHRADYEGLRAVLTARGGDANIGRAAVTLPHAAFLAQSHIDTICTRVQFAADQCPAGSIYGHAQATTPILGYRLEGPVYLRSNPEHELPDLVAKLRGPESQPIEIDLAGRTDSAKGALRNTFEVVPDAPVSRFSLELFGGRRGLVELSTDDYCARVHRATADFRAQNGRRLTLRPAVRNSKCAKGGKHHKRKGAHR